MATHVTIINNKNQFYEIISASDGEAAVQECLNQYVKEVVGTEFSSIDYWESVKDQPCTNEKEITDKVSLINELCKHSSQKIKKINYSQNFPYGIQQAAVDILSKVPGYVHYYDAYSKQLKLKIIEPDVQETIYVTKWSKLNIHSNLPTSSFTSCSENIIKQDDNITTGEFIVFGDGLIQGQVI
jgi:hypothetical protein